MNLDNYSTIQVLTSLTIPILTVTSIVFIMLIANPSSFLPSNSFGVENITSASDNLYNNSPLMKLSDDNADDDDDDDDSSDSYSDDELIISKVY